MPLQRIDSCALFYGLTPEQIQLLQEMIVERKVSAGEVIFGQGDPATSMYIVIHGMIVVRHKPYDEPWLDVATIQKDGIFGWSAVLGHQLYTSSAIALGDSTLVAIDGYQLRSLCLQRPDMGVILLERLAAAIADRYQNTQAHIIRMLNNEMEYNEIDGGRRKSHD
jgi:CRP-like cAMP-binding protein